MFFYRLGEIRDRSYENQRYRASGLKLVVAAITLWNTVYLERSIAALRQQREIDDSLISRIAPVGWNHINLTGDYGGMPTNALPRGDSGPCATENRRGRLGVRKNPFLEGTPKCVCTSANRGDGIRVQGTGHLLQRPTLVVERAKLA